jgi:hypothetical protein
VISLAASAAPPHNRTRRPARPAGASGVNGESMRRVRSRDEPEEMLPEYDFSGGVRGKYASRFAKDTIMVVLDPDVAEVFPDPKSVNKALRALGHIVRDRARQTGRRQAASGGRPSNSRRASGCSTGRSQAK